MKKLTFLLGIGLLPCIAGAQTFDLFDSQDHWTLSHINDSTSGHTAKPTLNTTDKTMSVSNNNWTLSYGAYQFQTPFDLSQAGSTLSFSVQIQVPDTSAKPPYQNCLATLTLRSANTAVVSGWGGYDKAPGNQGIQVGVAHNITTTDQWFRFPEGKASEEHKNTGEERAPIQAGIKFQNAWTQNALVTMTGTLTSLGDNQWTFSLACGEEAAQTITLTSQESNPVNLDTITGLTLSFGGANTHTPQFKNLTVTYAPVPEPACAALALAGLAGVCLHRRVAAK